MVAPTPTVMDAREWDRIADLLCQIEKKLRQLTPERIPCVNEVSMMHSHIMAALDCNDKLAEWDAMGWL
jgi:hypothetical protein